MWAQVLADLRVRLERGEFVERFATDVELIDEYQVSRHTVRDAVRRLHGEGLLDRERGRGTFVRGRPIEQPLGALYSLFRSIEAHGFEQHSAVRFLEERCDPQAAAMLELPADAALIYLERIRSAGSQRVAVDCSWLPADIARPLIDVDFERTALYQELADRCGARPTGGWERILPALATREQRELLQIPARQPIFAVERFTHGDGRPLEWRHSAIRGDLYAFIARWDDNGLTSEHALEPARATGR